jgi:cathepsin B
MHKNFVVVLFVSFNLVGLLVGLPVSKDVASGAQFLSAFLERNPSPIADNLELADHPQHEGDEHKDDDGERKVPLADAPTAMSCREIIMAEKQHKTHMRLFMKAVRDALPNMTKVRCVSAQKQVTDDEIVWITVKGRCHGHTKFQKCKVELLRTKADNITHALNSINEDGSDADSEEKKDQIKEANRYQIDECTTVPPPEGWSKKGRRPKTDKPQDEDDAPEAEADQPIELQVEPEAKYHMGHIKMAPQMWAQLRMHEATEAELAATPASFDVRERNSCKSHVIVDQGSCGSCWAFAASRVYSDRLCFKTNGATDITLSEQDILSCYTHGGYYPRTGVTDNGQTVTQYYRLASASTSDGCNGGSSAVAWMQMTGAAGGRVSRWADPYTGKGYQQDACGSHENAIEYKVGTDSIGARVFKLPANEASIKHAISSSGSISAGFDVYSCIMNFRGSTGLGIYTKSSSSYQGGHAVGVIGYGSDGGTDYWIMANSWGTGWGNNGYARIVRMTNGVDFEGEMSYPDPVVPDTCKDVAPCKNGGEFDGSCRCKCDSATQWSGADCNTCSASCENGGTVNAQSCSCNCADGYFGPTCSSYALLQWKSLSGSTGVLKASWSLDHSYTGSYYSRMAGPEGENGENTRISGTNQVASGRTGSVDITVNVLSYIPGYPTGMHYVFMESMGTNEFGASRGFKTIRIPSMFYDSTNRCVKGPHPPTTYVH